MDHGFALGWVGWMHFAGSFEQGLRHCSWMVSFGFFLFNDESVARRIMARAVALLMISAFSLNALLLFSLSKPTPRCISRQI